MNQGDPTVGETLEKALRHFNDGDLEEAGTLCEAVLEAAPGHAGALHMRGVILARRGRHDEAVASLTRAAQLQTDNGEIYTHLAGSLLATNRADQAIKASSHAIRLKPDHAVAHLTHGNALHRQGRLEEAAAAVSVTVHLEPDMTEGHFNLGNALRDQRRFDDSARAYRRAIELQPDLAQAHHNLGSVLHAAQGPEAGLTSYMKAIEQAPEMVTAFHNLGAALQQLGRFGDAAQAYRRTLSIHPDLAETYYCLVRATELREDDPAIGAMERLLADPALPRDDRVSLSFAMGSVLDGLGLHAEAFEHFHAANRLRREDTRFDIDDVAGLFDGLRRTFDMGLLGARSSWGSDSRLPVFVLGMPQTGKREVERLVASHPDGHGVGEFDCLRRVAQRVQARLPGALAFPDGISAMRSEDARGEGDALVEALARFAPRAKHIVDTLPDNALLLGLAGLIVPRARIIYCIRDPLDTCLACYFSKFPMGAQPYSYDLTELGAYFRLYGDLMEHWKSVLPNPFLEVRFEDLAERRPETMREILAFCGLEGEAASPGIPVSPLLTRFSAEKYAEHLVPLRNALEGEV